MKTGALRTGGYYTMAEIVNTFGPPKTLIVDRETGDITQQIWIYSHGTTVQMTPIFINESSRIEQYVMKLMTWDMSDLLEGQL
jgi:hypothetical protein